MPQVNVYYKFTKDQLIDTIISIQLQGKEANWKKDVSNKNSNLFIGVVSDVYVHSEIVIDVELAGEKKSRWTLEVGVVELEQDKKNIKESKNRKIIDIKKIKDVKLVDPFPIEGIIEENNYCGYHETNDIM